MKRIAVISLIAIAAIFVSVVCYAEPAWIDSTVIKGHAIGYGNMQVNSVGSTNIRAGAVERTDLANDVLRDEIITVISDTTLTSAQMDGTLIVMRPIGAKYTVTLPTAVAGSNALFFIADADSGLITAATGDSLIISTGAAYKTTSSVAATFKVTAWDATRWLIHEAIGTLTSY
jgi:hypothetical protein